MLLTIALCTWNRSALLRQALAQMTALVVPSGVDLELIVVNNNSTDDTDAVIGAFNGRLPIRRLFEEKPGQSNARNTAVAHARGGYILWTDDDVLVDSNWVSAYVKAFVDFPRGVVFGGPILPAFASPPPSWLTDAWDVIAYAYATRDLGAEHVRFDDTAMPFGANFVVRTDEQKSVQYDPHLGLRPGGSMRGEETDVIRKLLNLDHEGWWVPAASVRHHIPPERMTTGYLRSFFGGYGQYLAIVEQHGNCPMILGRPRWVWRQAIAAEAAYRVRRITSPARVWVRDLRAASTAWGRLFARRSQWPSPKLRSRLGLAGLSGS